MKAENSDAAGNPVSLKKGYYAVAKEYNASGKAIRTIYLDQGGRPVNTTDNYAYLVNEYDTAGNAVLEAYYTAEGEPFTQKKGYSALRKYYNDANKLVKTEYLDTNGTVVNTTDEFAVQVSDYDDQNREVLQAWYRADGSRATKKDKTSFLTKEYLEDGDLSVIRTRYYNANGDPVALNGYEVLEVYNDEKGTKVGEAYFDRNLNPVYKQKQAYVRLTIESQEDETVTTYYNAAGTVVKTDRK